MTESERAALLWLDECIVGARTDYAQEHARTLKDLLAQPRMPEEATPEIVATMIECSERVIKSPCPSREQVARAIYRAIHKLLSKPATRKYQRWLVVNDSFEHGPYLDEADAKAVAKRWGGWVVELTGDGP